MAIIQEHFITADEKERKKWIFKKKKRPKTYRLFNNNFSFMQKMNLIFHKKPKQFDYKNI